LGLHTVSDTLEQQKEPININCKGEIKTNSTVLTTPERKCGEAPEETPATNVQKNDEGAVTQPQPAKRRKTMKVQLLNHSLPKDEKIPAH
jgi:hypothetical protein